MGVTDPQVVALFSQLGIDAGTLETLISSAILITALTLAAAVPTVMLAKRKHRARTFWLLLALSIPVIPLLLIWLLPELPAAGNSSSKD